MGRSSTVLLEVSAHNMSKEFSVTHAEKLLRIKNNGGWALPKNSKYIFDLKNGITIKPNKKEPRGARR